MSRRRDDVDALARLAREAGGKVLSVATPGPGLPVARPAKYGNRAARYAGLRYDSKAEAAYAEALDRERAICPGMWWIRQPVFHLGVPENVYRADFLVISPDAPIPVRAVDVKGVRTAKFHRDVKLWRAYGPCPLIIAARKRGSWIEEVVATEGC